MKSRRTTFSCVLILLCLFSLQLGTASSAFAADAPTDLEINVYSYEHKHALQYEVCNLGTTHVTDFTVSHTFDNFTPEKYLYFNFASSAFDSGTVDPDTGNWSGGILRNSECVMVLVTGNLDAEVGETVGFTSSITQSTLLDSSTNVDPSSENDTSSFTSRPVTADADMGVSAKLLTPGTITAGSTFSYALKISNFGPGAFASDLDEPFYNLSLFFLMPEGASFVSISDTDTNDNLDVNTDAVPEGCQSYGDVQESFGPQMDQYEGDIVGCGFKFATGAENLPANTHYTFQVNMLATSSFVSGTTKIAAVLDGGDVDSVLYQATVVQFENFFALPINNVLNLTFDSTDLIPTFNPCPGQGGVINVNDACFTISFNKEIDAESFSAADLVIQGSGVISSFEYTSTNLWTIHVTGMESGKAIVITLAPDGIIDLSAVSNGTLVLGINTVRYETPGTANGTLAETGRHVEWVTPLVLLLIGFVLLKVTKRRHVSESELASLEHTYHH